MCRALADMLAAIIHQVGAGDSVHIPGTDEHEVLSQKRFHIAVAERGRFA
jgi:hypothetical protein